ncbi:hypothetical protein HGRIS_001176 [Hohenbuehelia grisea]|uniref:Uncharacterized protein n=1 Tax=Hohenbuehelia grisea TaxID=104357 RepID=A0ABR3JNH8_9AGAR
MVYNNRFQEILAFYSGLNKQHTIMTVFVSDSHSWDTASLIPSQESMLLPSKLAFCHAPNSPPGMEVDEPYILDVDMVDSSCQQSGDFCSKGLHTVPNYSTSIDSTSLKRKFSEISAASLARKMHDATKRIRTLGPPSSQGIPHRKRALRRLVLNRLDSKQRDDYICFLNQDHIFWKELSSTVSAEIIRLKIAESSRLAKFEEERLSADEQGRKREEEERIEQARLAAEEGARRIGDEHRAGLQNLYKEWSTGPWTDDRAIERYMVLKRRFQATRFASETNPLTFEDIPWPVLMRSVHHENITWKNVESFLQVVQQKPDLGSFLDFAKKSFRLFHPDAWIIPLGTVAHPEERQSLARLCLDVSQAVSSTWKTAKAQS